MDILVICFIQETDQRKSTYRNKENCLKEAQPVATYIVPPKLKNRSKSITTESNVPNGASQCDLTTISFTDNCFNASFICYSNHVSQSNTSRTLSEPPDLPLIPLSRTNRRLTTSWSYGLRSFSVHHSGFIRKWLLTPDLETNMTVSPMIQIHHIRKTNIHALQNHLQDSKNPQSIVIVGSPALMDPKIQAEVSYPKNSLLRFHSQP
ncbi:hypothetical protein CRE_09536 [Caenorhabditis remanei]|uniref:Uncharacterized protein n=1 Tax=Caenorhabditis remanei TaxID=31234 RepID=E3MJ19_CAERE|nr:hypothetical protein CRE_09536 [Caenorhabditis remanei]